MIVRRRPDGSVDLVTQNDHARLSGLFAAHWGNEAFVLPEPVDAVVRAAVFHDCTWSRYEATPRYDAQAHETPNYRQVPNDAEQLCAYQAALDWIEEIDPYLGLLVSRHRTGLWRGRYGVIAELASRNAAAGASPELEAFIARNEARQAQLMEQVDASVFEQHYRLLQIWDLFSLYWCSGDPKAMRIAGAALDGKTGPDERLTFTLTPLAPDRVALDPWPFDAPVLAGGFVYRRLETLDFPDVESFRRGFWGARPAVRAFEFVPA